MKQSEYKKVFEFLADREEKLKKNGKIQLLQQEGKVIMSKSTVSRIFGSIIFGLLFLINFIVSVFVCFLGIKESNAGILAGGILLLICNIAFAWVFSLVNKTVIFDFYTETIRCRKFFFWIYEYKFADFKDFIRIDKYNFYGLMYLGTDFKLLFGTTERLLLPNSFRKENIETINTFLNFTHSKD